MLLDIHLGGIAGIEPRRRLAAVGSNSPLIFMTAIDDEATRKEAMKAGCVARLKKPFAPQGKRWPSESADPADGRFAPEAANQEWRWVRSWRILWLLEHPNGIGFPS